MRIAPEKLLEIQENNDIVDVISEYLPLVKSGDNFKAKCPFCENESDSFVIWPDRQIFKCFDCDNKGNVFTFIQRKKGVSFEEAVNILS